MSEFFSLYTLFLTSKAPGCLFLSCETFKGLFLGGMHPADCAPKSVLPPPALFCCCFQMLQRASRVQLAPWLMLWDQQQFKVDQGTGSLVFQSLLIFTSAFPLLLQNIHVFLKGTESIHPLLTLSIWPKLNFRAHHLYHFPHYFPKADSFPPLLRSTPPPQDSDNFMEFPVASHPL